MVLVVCVYIFMKKKKFKKNKQKLKVQKSIYLVLASTCNLQWIFENKEEIN